MEKKYYEVQLSYFMNKHLMRLLENNYDKKKCYIRDVKLLDLPGNYEKKPGLHHSDAKGVVWGTLTVLALILK